MKRFLFDVKKVLLISEGEPFLWKIESARGF